MPEEQKIESTELDELLKLARSVREMLTINPGPLENCLLGFYSVAHRLNRQDDMVFAAKEMIGYSSGDKLPIYRKNVFHNVMAEDEALSVPQKMSLRILRDGLQKLEKMVIAKLTYTSDLSDETLKEAKNLKPTAGYYESRIPWSELASVISGAKLEVMSRLNNMIGEIAYGKIPQGIFIKFQEKVNAKLTATNQDAVNALEIAYESLGVSENPERIATVAFACRRLVRAVADQLVPPQNGEKRTLTDGKEVEIGDERFLNRIQVFTDSFKSPNRKYLLKEVALLRDLMNEVPESMNQGIHFKISNEGAERLVLKSYIILGSIILEGEKLENVQQSGT